MFLTKVIKPPKVSEIRVKSIKIKNYRSFGEEQIFHFPDEDYKKPVSIVGYNNCGKTNLMNCILYGIGEKYVTKETFSLNDFHNRNISNIPEITLKVHSSTEKKFDGTDAVLDGYHKLEITKDDEVIEGARIKSFNSDWNKNYYAFGALKYFNVFYVNFHCIKEQISTQKTNWGSLKSFLAKHIKKLIEDDATMQEKKVAFEIQAKEVTNEILSNSKLARFIEDIKINYSTNLRNNKCEIEFGLPDYDDIFLQMMFKIGLNCEESISELVPISHFGDGYISMFVMAVIQAIAECNTTDKCLFLFEEPESFLHENHQEYFYKTVLCNLAERGHQVIYTTHSDRMVDIFDTQGIIRIEFDENEKQTVKKYNNIGEFPQTLQLKNYNSFIKTIEPNLNKILFSRKVILVEGPNDVLSYKYAIEDKIKKINKDDKYAETYLSFLNIAVIPHHGKATALLLIELCKHIGLDYFVINDLDFEIDFIDELSGFDTVSEFKESNLYLEENGVVRSASSKGMLIVNWYLQHNAGKGKIHFNIPKLESVLGYKSNDKSSVGIWNTLVKTENFPSTFFPLSLESFLEFDKIIMKQLQPVLCEEEDDDLPF